MMPLSAEESTSQDGRLPAPAGPAHTRLSTREGGGDRVEVLRSEAELKALVPEWHSLLDRTPRAGPFLSPEWILPWWRHVGRARGAELRCLALYRAQQLSALAPLVVETERTLGLRTRVLRFAGHTLSDFQDVLLTGPARPTLERLARALLELSDWDLLDLRELDGESPHLELWIESLRRRCGWLRVLPDSACHYAPLDRDWESYHRSCFSRHHRKDQRREWRQLEARGDLVLAVHSAPGLTPAQLGEIAELERQHPHAGGTRPGGLNTEPEASFLREALTRLDRRGELHRTTLRCDGRLIAHYLGIRQAGSHFLYATAHHGEFRRGAAGKLLLTRTLEALWKEGGARVELLRGDQPLKRQWSTHVRQNARVIAARHAEGLQRWLWFEALPRIEAREPRIAALLRGERSLRAALARRLRVRS